ncbi:hypothetical protein WM24_06405 [Burkholderia ubonensis]|nr:hypothetical protein WM24_06405 [Burkholderia ubonensis]
MLDSVDKLPPLALLSCSELFGPDQFPPIERLWMRGVRQIAIAYQDEIFDKQWVVLGECLLRVNLMGRPVIVVHLRGERRWAHRSGAGY